jgi:hypothetical protein
VDDDSDFAFSPTMDPWTQAMALSFWDDAANSPVQ